MNDHVLAPTARWWEPDINERIRCTLCPRYCTLSEGQHGFCFIRQNIDGKLYSLGYGRPTGFGLDPIEKKPLNHFLPGSNILSFGTAGCNLGCKFCQNWNISKARSDHKRSDFIPPEDVIEIAKRYNTPSIAFTYNDPIIFGEYVIDIAELARKENIRTVMVTAGYIDPKAREEIFENIDAVNMDLKAFTEKFYFELTYSHLDNILDTISWIKNKTGIWMELTTLVIPHHNDSTGEITEMCKWIVQNLGNDVPLHFTAFYPDYKMTNIEPTPISTLVNARAIALREGIKFCYTGNVNYNEGERTYCPKCGIILIDRNRYSISESKIKNGSCSSCGSKIPGVFLS